MAKYLKLDDYKKKQQMPNKRLIKVLAANWLWKLFLLNYDTASKPSKYSREVLKIKPIPLPHHLLGMRRWTEY